MPAKKKGKAAKAKAAQQAALEPQGHKEQGNAAFAKKDYPNAIKFYTSAIVDDSDNHVLYSNRSAAYLGLASGDALESALHDAETCITKNPEWPKVSRQCHAIANQYIYFRATSAKPKH